MTIAPLAPRAETFHFDDTSRSLTREFAAGYQAGIAWMEYGAPKPEVDLIADFYEYSRPDQRHAEATRYLDAGDFLGLLAFMHANGHGNQFEIVNGADLRKEFARDYGEQFLNWDLPNRVFAMYGLGSFYDGLATAVWQASRG